MAINKIIIAVVCIIQMSTVNAMSDGAAAIIGIVIGSQIKQPEQRTVVQPMPTYGQSDPCYAYKYDRIEMAYCRGLQDRIRRDTAMAEREAYERGFRGN